MAEEDPKMHSITGTLTPLMLTERDDYYNFNVTYLANHSIKDICKLTANKSSKYTAAQYESMYMDLFETVKEEVYSSSTVEFGFTNNSVGVDGPLIGIKPTFDPAVNSVTLHDRQKRQPPERSAPQPLPLSAESRQWWRRRTAQHLVRSRHTSC